MHLEDGVATVTVDNPPVNALNDATLVGLRDVAEQLAVGRARAVVLTGAGTKAFLAGADLREIQGNLGRAGAMDAHVALTRSTFDAWRRLPQPLVAAVQAHAVGGGFEFALLCDLIVSNPSARFGMPEVTLGLVPGGGGTQRLPRRVPQAQALALLLLGDLIDAYRARDIGIVNEVSDDGGALQRAQDLASRLAALPALAVQAAKRAARLESDIGLSDGLEAESALFLATAASSDAREGASAFLEKRAASFEHC